MTDKRPMSVGEGIAASVGLILVFLVNPLGWVGLLVAAIAFGVIKS